MYIRDKETTNFPKLITSLAETARKKVGRLDAVIMPEQSLGSKDYEVLREQLKNQKDSLIFIGGVGDSPSDSGNDGFSSNYAQHFIPLDEKDPLAPFLDFKQHKHHPWILTQEQIARYGFGSTLNPEQKYFENISIGSRRVSFVTLHPFLTFCTLICEDLARQDPIAEIIRAVGPTLVICLLQDGPQLSWRWASRCASVLADEVGCSVLTLTSLGMAKLWKPTRKEDSNRVIGLWKDRTASHPKELLLPKGAKGLVLTLNWFRYEEMTPDGRGDGKCSSGLNLSGDYPL
jgi:hypothetical protein